MEFLTTRWDFAFSTPGENTSLLEMRSTYVFC